MTTRTLEQQYFVYPRHARATEHTITIASVTRSLDDAIENTPIIRRILEKQKNKTGGPGKPGVQNSAGPARKTTNRH
jgi:hypothetical protein